jgi:hypothetical protein
MLSEIQESESYAVVVTPDLSQASVSRRTRLWQLVNLCSLDAVTVGLIWQLIFTLQFCGRFPSWVENSIIGTSIWLAYTADRILDSRHLQCDLPHTSRHHFHHQFRRPICFLWILALVFNVILIIHFSTVNQIKWGMGCLLLVCFYLLNVQKTNWTIRRVPKEIQAGCIFGFGVSLVSWSSSSDQPTFQLFFSTAVTGFLFSINCATVAYWERQLDAAQTFFSWTARRSATLYPIAIALVLEFALIMSLLFFEAIPRLIAGCLLSSTLCLAITVMTNRKLHMHCPDALLTKPLASRELLADISLILPPSVLIILSV